MFKLKILLILFISLFYANSCIYSTVDTNNILIISSYNPIEKRTSRNISEFMEEYNKLDKDANIIIENLNCKSFSEVKNWRDNMDAILTKYHDSDSLDLIILLGQEAATSYLTVQDSMLIDVPVMCGMIGKNLILLPNDTVVNTNVWMPPVDSVFKCEYANRVIKSAFCYQYDIDSNINMIMALYPETKNIAFISDNTYGGVTMQALVRDRMKHFSNLNLILLDGRVNTIYTIVDQIRKLPPHTVILLGTWRIDMNEGYFMRNAIFSMMEANPNIPVFAPASVSVGSWAIGGVYPDYKVLGKDMAAEALRIVNEKEYAEQNITYLSTKAELDYNKIKDFKLDTQLMPFAYTVINQPISIFEQYKLQAYFLISVILLLGLGLLLSLYFYFKTKRLKDKLQISEAHLYEAKNNAEESNRLKSSFLANMSHEIRTPLNAIVGFSDVISSEDISKEEVADYNHIIKSNADLLLRLINDILDLSRLEAGKINLKLEECDIVKICQQAIFSVEYLNINNNEFNFECEYSSFITFVDSQRMQQILINLLSNANKFTVNGVITVCFWIDEKDENALFSVTDTGCGIPKNKQNLIFDRFEKLNEYDKGTGLGLAICKLIIEKWGGAIWLDPEYTEGARFVFSYPLNFNKDVS